MRLENSFILAPGIGEKTEKKLWKKDITHWDDVEDKKPLSETKQEKIEIFLEKARKNLEVKNSYFFSSKLPNKEDWRIYRNFSKEACFIDIETTGLDKKRNKVTTVGIHRDGESKVLVRDQDLNREKLRKEIKKSSMLVSFNGKRFDQPFLEHNFDIKIEKPHIDLMYPCKRLGYSGGLKKIEKQLGIQRDLEDVDGREAVRLWKKYENKGDEKALRKLMKYNKYDAKNLEELIETVHKQMRSKVYEPHLSNK